MNLDEIIREVQAIRQDHARIAGRLAKLSDALAEESVAQKLKPKTIADILPWRKRDE